MSKILESQTWNSPQNSQKFVFWIEKQKVLFNFCHPLVFFSEYLTYIYLLFIFDLENEKKKHRKFSKKITIFSKIWWNINLLFTLINFIHNFRFRFKKVHAVKRRPTNSCEKCFLFVLCDVVLGVIPPQRRNCSYCACCRKYSVFVERASCPSSSSDQLNPFMRNFDHYHHQE